MEDKCLRKYAISGSSATKLHEPPFCRLVMTGTRVRSFSYHASLSILAPRCQRMSRLTRRRPCTSGYFLLFSVRSLDRNHTQTLPLTGRVDPTEANVRSLTVTPSSLHFLTELIHVNSNFFSLAKVPTPPSVHHHVLVC
jgi:hypothetical protein